MRLFSLFPSGEYFSKNQFANYLPTLGLAGWHYTRGVKTVPVKAKRLTSKDVQGSARDCKLVEGAGSHF
jgi:hypothetical protein